MTTKTMPKIMLPGIGRAEEAITIFKKDPVFTCSVVLALASCLVARPKPGYIDFKVLASLFNIMIVVKAFEELHLLERASVAILNGCSDSRKVSLVLIMLCFFSSMVFTNDVALLTLVPLTLAIGRKSGLDMLPTVILQTLAANIGSSLTPMGNPQNLYIFSYYALHAWQFFSTIGPFAEAGLLWLVLLAYRNRNKKIDFMLETVELKEPKQALIWGILFVVIVLSIFGVINYLAAFLLVLATALCINRALLLKADYPLLLTFVCFFIFIGNVSHIPAVSELMKSLLSSANSTYFGSILFSQVISNVPSAILLSGFTGHWKELLLGVNIGGMGTVIASLASVISYKLYIGENSDNAGKYMARFSLWNFSGLALFTLFNYLLLQL
jgi:Na+/H+ antiporter NhaD/arsenite permease-like protein